MVYRTLTTMTIGGRRLRTGRAFRDTGLSATSVAGLLRAQRIAPVCAPPLEVLPGWAARAAQIAAQYGVTDTAEFIELVGLPEPFAGWQADALRALDAPYTGCQNCRRY